MTTLNKTLEELTFEFSGIGGILHDAFSSTENSVSTIKNNSNINQRKRRYANISGPNGVEGMTTKFSEAENELLKKSSAQIISAPIVGNPLAPYQNNLPYGVPAAGDVNQELHAVSEKSWTQFSKDMGKIFQKIGKDQLNAMTSQNSHLKGQDIENMVYSTCGSLGEWPQINPKSAGLGKCSKLFDVFANHYKRYNGKIDESKFYSELISSLHTSEIFALSRGITGRRNTTGIQGFSSEVKVYNIDTSLWFPSDEIINGKQAKYQGFLKEDEDSYGTFFDIGGFPIRYQDYVDNTKIYLDNTTRGTLTEANYDIDNNAINGQSKNTNGTYTAYTDNTHFNSNDNIVVVKNVKVQEGTTTYNVNKRYCMLFKYEGDTDINKQKAIDKKISASYLFNTDTNKIPRCLYNYPDNLMDTIITQRTDAIVELLIIRLMIEQVYGINDNIIPAQRANIFQINANITNTVGGSWLYFAGLAANPYVGTKYRDDFNTTKNKLLNQIDNKTDSFSKLLRKETVAQLKLLLNRMNDGAPPAVAPADLGDVYYDTYIRSNNNKNYIIGMNIFRNEFLSSNKAVNDVNYNQFYADLIAKAYSIHGNVFNNAGDSFSFLANNITEVLANHNFVNDLVTFDVGNNRNGTFPVLVYRFLMRRMVAWYKRQYFSTATTNNNNNNLYRTDTAIAVENANTITLTQARAQGAGTYDNLTNFKQAIPNINPIMVGGGSRKSSHNNLIKTGGKKSKIIQKGGTSDLLFVGNARADLPKLYANRKLMNFNASQYELAVKKYKELGFNADYAKVKLLFDKISQISYLPLFFNGYQDILNISCGGGAAESGGCGVVPPNNTQVPLSFSDVAQLFLFNSVNTTTTTLLIHFLKNVKACLNHFITTDLKVVNDDLSKQITGSQSDKIEGSLRELIKEIDKVVNFLKYNTLNLQEQSVRLNDDDGRVTPAQKFQNNEHYIKNLFLGANVFFSHANTAAQSVVMRFTGNDGDAAAVEWHGDEFFQFLNGIVGCTENSNIFGNTLKFLTDSNNPVNQALQVYQATPAGVLTAGNNPYLEKIRPYLKDKPDGCFGGIPFVSLDPKVFSLLMRSFYLLLGLRLAVGIDVQANDRIEEETAYSKLSQDKKTEITRRIQDTLTLSVFSTLAESLKSQATIDKANMMFNTIFRYLFIESRRLISQVNQAKQEINKSSKIGNKKNSKKGLFTGGGPSIYTFRKTTSLNQQTNLIKSEVNYIKTTYQASAEIEYIISEILIQLKKEIERRGVKNELHFFYYTHAHLENFKIFMNTYLLTVGENNIPPEMAKKLQDYISYSPDKNKALDSFKKLTQVPLINPQYSDPLWWAKIERKFMDIQQINGPPQNDSVYRLFIITTTPPAIGKLRDMYIIDAFGLATLNTGKSSDKYWITTGDRTHVGIRKTKDANGDKIYLDTNTAIKLTGIGSSGVGYRQNSTKARIMTPLRDKNINKQVRGAIDEDIRDLICGKFKYYDRSTNSFKTLIPIFLQANKNDVLKGIVNRQKDDMFRSFETKFRLGPNVDYRIYQISDDYIKDLKKYRQWLYQIFVEQQMQLTKPEVDKFDSIERTMISSFSGKFFSTNASGKCTRVYNIYDYIVLQSSDATENATTKNKKMSNFRNPADPKKKHPTRGDPAPIQEQKIRYPDPNLSTADFGSEMVSGFISRESLIKLMIVG